MFAFQVTPISNQWFNMLENVTFWNSSALWPRILVNVVYCESLYHIVTGSAVSWLV